MSIDLATLFKREHVARAVTSTFADGKRKSDLLLAKITIKNRRG